MIMTADWKKWLDMHQNIIEEQGKPLYPVPRSFNVRMCPLSLSITRSSVGLLKKYHVPWTNDHMKYLSTRHLHSYVLYGVHLGTHF